MDDFFTILIIANRFPIFRAIMASKYVFFRLLLNTYFDAIIALKIGNRLAIIKIVKKSSMGLCCLIFSYNLLVLGHFN